jgi:hypothetical protein
MKILGKRSQSGEFEALIKKTQPPKTYAQPGIEMIQSVEADPPPAVETMALTQLELRHLEEIVPHLWEERHLLLKIPLRK